MVHVLCRAMGSFLFHSLQGLVFLFHHQGHGDLTQAIMHGNRGHDLLSHPASHTLLLLLLVMVVVKVVAMALYRVRCWQFLVYPNVYAS